MSQQRNERPLKPSADFPDLPDATVARLPEYLRALHELSRTGNDVVSSEGLATAAGVNSAKLRKDLSYLRSNGTRGVGYDVTQLIEKIEYVLGLNQHRAVALVGIGILGHALAGYAGFGTRGYHIAALFDADPARVGEEINGLVVRRIDELAEVGALGLSTCNRVEVHAGVSGFHGGPTEIVAVLARRAGCTPTELAPYAYVHYDTEAVRHAYRVATGLDSMVVGEA